MHRTSTDLFFSSFIICQLFQLCPIFNFVQFSIVQIPILSNSNFVQFQFCPIFNYVQFSIMSNFQFWQHYLAQKIENFNLVISYFHSLRKISKNGNKKICNFSGPTFLRHGICQRRRSHVPNSAGQKIRRESGAILQRGSRFGTAFLA